MRSKIGSLKVKELTVNECKQVKGGGNGVIIIKPTSRPRPWMVVPNM